MNPQQLTSAAIYDIFAADQLADDERPAQYRAPDGEYFSVRDILRDGTVIADSGRTFTSGEFNECERIESWRLA